MTGNMLHFLALPPRTVDHSGLETIPGDLTDCWTISRDEIQARGHLANLRAEAAAFKYAANLFGILPWNTSNGGDTESPLPNISNLFAEIVPSIEEDADPFDHLARRVAFCGGMRVLASLRGPKEIPRALG